MPLDDPFVCKRCYGHASYAGRRHGETIYRCQSCGAENSVVYKVSCQQQQQSQRKAPDDGSR